MQDTPLVSRQLRLSRPGARVATYILLAVLVFASPACDNADLGQEGVFTVELTWDKNANLDLLVWNSSSECSRHRCFPGSGQISSTAAQDMGPESYESPYDEEQHLRYSIAVNYRDGSLGPVQATVKVKTGADTQTYGPFVLNAPDNGADGCPVNSASDAWWRPTDVTVDGTSVALVTANVTTSLLNSAGSCTPVGAARPNG